MLAKQDPRPLYMKVVDILKEEIRSGRFKAGQQLPPEPQLAKTLGVSRATLREGLRVLDEEHLVERIQGIGTFVRSKPKIKSGIEELSSITDMIIDNGQTPGSIILSCEPVPASAEDQKRFQLEDGEEVLQLKRIRTADEEPIIYCIDKIPLKLLPAHFQYNNHSLFEDLKELTSFEIGYAESEISAISSHREISKKLNCDGKESLLVLNQMHYDKMDRPILYSNNYFRANKFNFTVVRRRKI